MVFSKLCYRHKRLGQGVIVPFLRPTQSSMASSKKLTFWQGLRVWVVVGSGEPWDSWPERLRSFRETCFKNGQGILKQCLPNMRVLQAILAASNQ